MSDLTIDRLSATTHGDAQRVDRLLRRVAATRLGDALRHHPLPAGDWCVRHVDVAVRHDPDRPASAVETEWADAIVTAVVRSLDDTTGSPGGPGDVVHYRRHEDAVDDCLTGLATRDHARAWAWRQLGLLRSGEPHGDGRAAALRILRSLVRSSSGGDAHAGTHSVAGVVRRLVERAGPAAAHRLLGRSGWHEAATLAAAQAGVALTDETWRAARPHDPTSAEPTGFLPSLLASGQLASRLRTSGLQVDADTLTAWAVLVLAGTDAPALRGDDVAERLRVLSGSLRPAAHGQAPRTPRERPTPVAGPALTGTPRPAAQAGSGEPSPTTGLAAATAAGPTATEPTPAEPTPAEPTPAEPTPAEPTATEPTTATGTTAIATTAWGGLLFLLNTATAAGLPGAFDGPALAGRPLPWLVQHVAVRIVPALPDDAAVLALAGLDPEPEPEPTAPASRAEAEALDVVAARWVAATADLLRDHLPDLVPDDGRTEDDAALVRRITRRQAGIVREPGWVEVRLRLDEVDLDVRRCGLDIDPGWVWWLGQVVRFVHE